MKTLKRLVFFLIIILLIAQFFNPKKNQGNLKSLEYFYEDTTPPEHVKIILKKNCTNCHSNVTHYPWYSTLTPLNFWIAKHVKEGKNHFNMSNWQGNATKRKAQKFEALIKMFKTKQMPLPPYTWYHNQAKLNDTDIKEVVNWAKLVRLKYGLEPMPE
ncbi:heme-binding domain-containing protein [Mariniflexile ostreae]|uniref:Heme-binding domain-containing protein n=1 Tax=Mariniflexile ostreae TaxID=1520892 RepID=A0ABV5FFS0_9FLAO